MKQKHSPAHKGKLRSCSPTGGLPWPVPSAAAGPISPTLRWALGPGGCSSLVPTASGAEAFYNTGVFSSQKIEEYSPPDSPHLHNNKKSEMDFEDVTHTSLGTSAGALAWGTRALLFKQAAAIPAA